MTRCPKCNHEWDDAGRSLFSAEVARRMQEICDGPPRVEAAYLRHHPRTKFGNKEWGLINARMNDGWSSDDLILAIEGCHKSPWHCGENPSGKKYQTLALILRDSSHVQQFIDIAKSPVQRSPRTRDDAVEAAFLRRFEA